MTLYLFNQGLWMIFKAFYSIWMFYEGNERYLRGKKGVKNGAQHLPQEETAACPHAKTLTLSKTKILLLFILPLVLCLRGCIC